MELINFIKRICDMLVGATYWSYLVRNTKNVGNTAIVLIPNNVKEEGLYAIEFVEELMEQKGYDNALFLIMKRREQLYIKRFGHNPRILYLQLNKLFETGLKQFYLYKNFDSRFYYASISEPFRRNGQYLVGRKGMDRREIFARGVYGISIEN